MKRQTKTLNFSLKTKNDISKHSRTTISNARIEVSCKKNAEYLRLSGRYSNTFLTTLKVFVADKWANMNRNLDAAILWCFHESTIQKRYKKREKKKTIFPGNLISFSDYLGFRWRKWWSRRREKSNIKKGCVWRNGKVGTEGGV